MYIHNKRRVVKITKKFEFEMAHKLNNHAKKCKYIHGHSYKLEVTVSGIPLDDSFGSSDGMVMDFGDLKALVKESVISKLDHALLLKEGTNLGIGEEKENIIKTNFTPTAEMLAIWLREQIEERISKEEHYAKRNVAVANIRLYETSTSYVDC